jgi:Uma2 family endonuclease
MSTAANPATAPFVSEQWKDVLEEILPPQGTWTDEQYLVLTNHTNRLIEFSDGFLEVLPTPTEHHQAILEFLFLAFLQFIKPKGGKVRFAPLRLQVRQGKFREPDLMLVLSASDPRRQNQFWTGADLALEVVSPEKPERDVVDKRTDYAEARVPEYWMVNPQTETITVLRLQGSAYVEVGTFRRGESAASVLLGGFAVDVAGVFDAD